MAATPQAPPLPNVLYATLSGPVDQPMVQRVFQGFSVAINGGVTNIHVLFQSTGGVVGDGIALYNYLKSVPIEVNIYNGGSVASIAVIAFLAGRQRYASASATFSIHRTYANSALFTSSATANAARLRGIAQSLEIDDARTLAIFRANLSLADDSLDNYLTNEIPFDSNAALQAGIITAIREFSPPPGAKLFNI
jgi:ATP-dependent Clp protease protease subunit